MDIIVSTDNLRYAHSTNDKPKYTEFSNHIHDQYEILYFISGSADYIIGNMRHRLNSGDLVITPPLLSHYVQILKPQEYDRAVINFKFCHVPDGVLKQVFSSPKVLNTTGNPFLRDLFKRFEYYHNTFSDNDRALLFNNLLSELIYLIYDALGESSNFTGFGGYNSTVKNIIKYIDKNLLAIDGIEDICKNMYISRSYLHKVFLNSLGISPMKYIKAKRLMLAQEMIQLGEKPSNVYAKAHYNDYTSFFRAYKSFFGYPPVQTKTRTNSDIVTIK